MVCGVLYGCFGLLMHKHGCYFQNFILFQIEILLYNIIMQNTLDQWLLVHAINVFVVNLRGST